MKKTLLSFSSFILLAIALQAQKCKFDYDKKDEITGLTTRAIHVRQATKGVSLIQKGDIYVLGIAVLTAGSRSETIEIGDSLIVKLENEKILYLFAKEQALPVTGSTRISDGKGGYTQGPMHTTYTINYSLPKETLKELKVSPIRLCRVVFPGPIDFTLDYRDKAMIRIQNGATCMDGSD
jgi:hypothetical protein